MKKLIVALLIFAGLTCCAMPSMAEGNFDPLDFAKNVYLLNCHSTAKLEDAKAEYDKDFTPAVVEGINQVRVIVNYKGWISAHKLVVDIFTMDTVLGKMIKVDPKSDTNRVKAPSIGGMKYEKVWTKVSDEAGFDYLNFALKNVLPEYHSTASVEKSTAEYYDTKQPTKDANGVETARIYVKYPGLSFKTQTIDTKISTFTTADGLLVNVHDTSDTGWQPLPEGRQNYDNVWTLVSDIAKTTPAK